MLPKEKIEALVSRVQAIDARLSVVGDLVTAVVDSPVKKDGRVVVPKGAVLHSRLRLLQKQAGRSTYYLIGLELSSIEFENKQARLTGRLEDIGPLPGVPARRAPQLTSDTPPGVSTIYVPATGLLLPHFTRLLWHTSAPATEPRP